VLFSLVWTALPLALTAQQAEDEILLEEQAEASEQSELADYLNDLRDSPLDLNTATLEQLLHLPGVTNRIARLILAHREKAGRFRKKQDLLQVKNLDPGTAERFLPFVTVTAPQQTQRLERAIHLSLRNRVHEFVDTPVGYQDGTYNSSSQKLYNRLLFSYGDGISGGFLMEKDSGERNLSDLKLFFVKLAFARQVEVTVGNFLMEAAQGLVLWGPYGFSKGADTISPVQKRARGIRGFTAVDENAAFRGAALTLKTRNVFTTLFLSQQALDATRVSDDAVSGFVTSGFHRTELEQQKADVLAETSLGARLQIRLPYNLNLGSSAYFSRFSKTIAPPDAARRQFDFRGKENAVLGLDMDWSSRNTEFFAEAARSQSGGTAVIAGGIMDYGRLQLAVHYRNYQKDFHSFRGFGFANSNGSTRNESGYYLGVAYKAGHKTRFNAYLDIFSRPWRTFSLPAPSQGHDLLAQLSHSAGKDLQLTFRMRTKTLQEMRDVKDALNRTVRQLSAVQQDQFRFQLDYSATADVRLRSRIEFKQVRGALLSGYGEPEPEEGFLLYQEIHVRPAPQLKISSRWTFFETDSFDARLFQYEHDLPGMLTNRALFGRGSRWYLLIRYHPFSSMMLSFKFAETYRDDVTVIGSGADQIPGNRSRKFGLQLDLKF